PPARGREWSAVAHRRRRSPHGAPRAQRLPLRLQYPAVPAAGRRLRARRSRARARGRRRPRVHRESDLLAARHPRRLAGVPEDRRTDLRRPAQTLPSARSLLPSVGTLVIRFAHGPAAGRSCPAAPRSENAGLRWVTRYPLGDVGAGPVAAQRVAHRDGAARHPARDLEDLRVPAGRQWSDRGALFAPRPRWEPRDGRWRADSRRALHSPGRVRPVGGNGVRVLHGPRSAKPPPAAESGRTADPFLLHLPVSRARRRGPAEPRPPPQPVRSRSRSSGPDAGAPRRLLGLSRTVASGALRPRTVHDHPELISVTQRSHRSLVIRGAKHLPQDDVRMMEPTEEVGQERRVIVAHV